MTDSQLRDGAVAYLKQTTIGWNKAKNYSAAKLATTNWGKALNLFDQMSATSNITLKNSALVYLYKTTAGYSPTGTNWKKGMAELAKIKDSSTPSAVFPSKTRYPSQAAA